MAPRSPRSHSSWTLLSGWLRRSLGPDPPPVLEIADLRFMAVRADDPGVLEVQRVVRRSLADGDLHLVLMGEGGVPRLAADPPHDDHSGPLRELPGGGLRHGALRGTHHAKTQRGA